MQSTLKIKYVALVLQEDHLLKQLVIAAAEIMLKFSLNEALVTPDI